MLERGGSKGLEGVRGVPKGLRSGSVNCAKVKVGKRTKRKKIEINLNKFFMVKFYHHDPEFVEWVIFAISSLSRAPFH